MHLTPYKVSSLNLDPNTVVLSTYFWYKVTGYSQYLVCSVSKSLLQEKQDI